MVTIEAKISLDAQLIKEILRVSDDEASRFIGSFNYNVFSNFLGTYLDIIIKRMYQGGRYTVEPIDDEDDPEDEEKDE